MSLMREIHEFSVPKGQVALWWFGQNGYLLKSPEGTIASVDLYLTDSCTTLGAPVNLSRQVPVLIAPEEIDVDIYTCTHSHQDHTDPETIRGLRHKDAMQFVGPIETCGIYRQEKIEDGRITLAYPRCDLEFKDLKIRGTWAVPTDDTDLNHMGFVFQFGDGPKIYFTGDTDYHELLASAGKHEPDLMITCINGGYNNLSHWEAATLAKQVKPKVAIPCHYDMFPDNSVDPRQFRSALAIQAPDIRYQQLEHGKPFLFSTGL